MPKPLNAASISSRFCWLFAFLALLLAGCSSLPPAEQSQLNSLTTLPQAHQITNLPFFAQELYQCGPASLAGVLNYRGSQVTPEQLKSAIYIPEREGSLQLEMVARARREGYIVYPLAPALDQLLMEVANNNPVLVLQNLRFGWWPQWHYAVVTGYDLAANTITLNSGTIESYTINLPLFARTWRRSKQWAIVITQATQLPATAEPLAFIKAVNNLEQVGLVSEARVGYQTAIGQWPTEPLALFGLANLLQQQKAFTQSQAIYQQLLTGNPGFAAGWNNYAYLLQTMGCNAAARQAAQCAHQLVPEDSNFADTLAELSAGAERNSAAPAQCPKVVCAAGE
ncbi:PA2778 family cysteine peptidase [Halioxenophilus sp. WMMB6]|uniref:PA2778 family cysteine peptidase n=1 Tax=Halioxenophilus sp. WMMB6 TaxID=3073815 RepID=UPI00295E38C8|nr:PA2778 family cysteine peptidase [Halioxenophilus sp. WMMB6]